MKIKFIGVMLLVALFTSITTSAQEKHKHSVRTIDEMFEKVDTDRDGKISMAEVDKAGKQKLKANFTAIDTNKDSYVDKEELKAYRHEKKKKEAKNQN